MESLRTSMRASAPAVTVLLVCLSCVALITDRSLGAQKPQSMYLGAAVGMPTGVLLGVYTPDAFYDTLWGVQGGDFTATFAKLYGRALTELHWAAYDVPVLLGWGMKFRNSYHPQYVLRGVVSSRYAVPERTHTFFFDIAPGVRVSPSWGVALDVTLGIVF